MPTGFVRLETVLGTSAKVRLMRCLCRQPDRWFTEADLAREVGMSPNTVNLALRDIAGTGVVEPQGDGRGRRVRLRRASPVVPGLLALFDAEARALKELAALARPILGREASCTLFGSVARGDWRPDSDVDLLIVARSRSRAVDLGMALDEAFRTVAPATYRFLYLTPGEFRAKQNLPVYRAIRREGLDLGEVPLEAWL